MKNFLIKILRFFAFLLIINLIIYLPFYLIHQFKPDINYDYKEFNSAYEDGDFDILAIGNSKLQAALDNRVLSSKSGLKSCVLGYRAANISFSKITLESYLNKSRVKPKTVLFEVSWFTFNKDRTFLPSHSGDLLLKDPSLFKYFLKYGTSYRHNFFSSLVEQISKSDTEIIDTKKEINNVESSPFERNYQFDLQEFENVFPDHIAGINQVLLDDFNKIVDMCIQNNIKLILFTAPEDIEYSKNQKDIDSIKVIFHDISKKYELVSYLDYTLNGDYYGQEYEYWLYDSHHINNRDLFTELLIIDMRKLSLLGNNSSLD